MKYFFLLFISSSLYVNAQQEGIKFTQGLTWQQIKHQAKKENKYIFLDCFTTWCIPCKEMSTEVFTDKKVGEFFNQNFINVAAQFDKTKKDNGDVRAWYRIVDGIKKEYKVSSYPSYLFFNPNGELVYKILGKHEAVDFIEKAKNSLSPKTQYPTLKSQYLAGRRDTSFLALLINAASSAGDRDSLPSYVNQYFKIPKKNFSRQDFMFSYYGIEKTTDSAFKITQRFSKSMDSLFWNGYSKKTVNRIIFNEFIFNDLRTNGRIINRGGGMYEITGEVNQNINWQKSIDKIKYKFPQQQEQVIRYAKTEYYNWLKDWKNYSSVVNEYSKDPNLDGDEIMDYANLIFQFSNDDEAMKSAISWCNLAERTEDADKTRAKYINAILLYKLGNKESSIEKMEALIKEGGRNSAFFLGELTKIKNNEKLWYSN